MVQRVQDVEEDYRPTEIITYIHEHFHISAAARCIAASWDGLPAFLGEWVTTPHLTTLLLRFSWKSTYEPRVALSIGSYSVLAQVFLTE